MANQINLLAEQAEQFVVHQTQFPFGGTCVTGTHSAPAEQWDALGEAINGMLEFGSVWASHSGTVEVLGIEHDDSVTGTFTFPNGTAVEPDSIHLRMVSGSGEVPYFVEITFSLGDIALEGPVELKVDQDDNKTFHFFVEGKLENVNVVVELEPPRPGRHSFCAHDDPAVSYTLTIDKVTQDKDGDGIYETEFDPEEYDESASEYEPFLQEVDRFFGQVDGAVRSSMASDILSSQGISDACKVLKTRFWEVAAMETVLVTSAEDADADCVRIKSVSYEPSRHWAYYEIVPYTYDPRFYVDALKHEDVSIDEHQFMDPIIWREMDPLLLLRFDEAQRWSNPSDMENEAIDLILQMEL